jgi:hypothetical protein
VEEIVLDVLGVLSAVKAAMTGERPVFSIEYVTASEYCCSRETKIPKTWTSQSDLRTVFLATEGGTARLPSLWDGWDPRDHDCISAAQFSIIPNGHESSTP